MIRIVRRIGIAIGSLVIAYLAVMLVAGVLFGPTAAASPVVTLIVIVLGGLVFADIVRRERSTTAAPDPSPRAHP